MKSIPFRTFNSVVTALSGETAFGGGGPGTHGTYDICEDLYLNGYNVHYYDEAQESRCIAEMNDQGNLCEVNSIAVFGYSHGGGSTYRVVNSGLGGLNLLYTGYIDAVNNSFTLNPSSEERRPPGSPFHFNYYQTNGFLNGQPSVPVADQELDLTATTDHSSIDNDATVINDLTASLRANITP